MTELLSSPVPGGSTSSTGRRRWGRRRLTISTRPPLVRSPVYVLRALVGTSLVGIGLVTLLVFEHGVLGVREDLAALQSGWPDWVTTALEVGVGLPVFATILVVNVLLLVRRMFRRWVVINLAAVAALTAADALGLFVLSVAPSGVLQEARVASSAGGLGNALLASAVAVLTVASVWIGPRLRPWAIGFTAAVGAFSFIGVPLSMTTVPVDVGLGMLVGSLVALVVGTRDRTPTQAELVSTLAADGLEVVDARRASLDARGSVPWYATTATGDELFVKTLGADQRAADLLFRAYRALRFRHVGDRKPHSSLRRAVEHEALLSLAASARGIRTPQLQTVAEIGSDGMLLAYRRVQGHGLDELDPARVGDDTLTEVWRLVGQLRDAAIAHRDLRLANVFVDADGTPWMIDFGFAELAAEPALLARDAAELLASTAAIVGSDRAVAAALRALGPEVVREALPWVQPLALSTATRGQLQRTETCEHLRGVASRAVGADAVEYEQLERVRPATLLMLATMAAALYVLVPQLAAAAGLTDELLRADLGWVAAAVALSVGTYIGAGLGMLGAVPVALPLTWMTLAQVAGSFANRVTPAKVGGMATNVRYLQKQGLSMSTAASAVGLNTVAGTVVHISLLVTCGVVVSGDVTLPLPDARMTAIVVTALILLSGLVMLVRPGRRLVTAHLVPALRASAASVTTVARNPRKLAALFAGSATVTTCYTGAMLASLAAFGAELPLATAALVYLAGAAVASAAPTPGGVGATEAALVAGYTAVGVDGSTALAAVLLFRAATFWLPILPGWLALVSMQRAGRL